MDGIKDSLDIKNIKPHVREHYEAGDISADVVFNGDGKFTLQIFGLGGQQFHPVMHRAMVEAISTAVRSRLQVAKGQVDFKVEWVDLMNSYCVPIIGVHNIMWAELFKLIVEDIAKDFRFANFTRR